MYEDSFPCKSPTSWNWKRKWFGKLFSLFKPLLSSGFLIPSIPWSATQCMTWMSFTFSNPNDFTHNIVCLFHIWRAHPFSFDLNTIALFIPSFFLLPSYFNKAVIWVHFHFSSIFSSVLSTLSGLILCLLLCPQVKHFTSSHLPSLSWTTL